MNVRPDLFTTVHKGLRWWMSTLSAALGAIDASDVPGREALLDDLLRYLDALDAHSLHEETFIGPLLDARGGTRVLAWHEDHAALEEMCGSLRRQAHALRTACDAAQTHGLALQLYRSFARFSSAMLMHLDEEETTLMPLLWSVCSDEELAGAMLAFRARHGEEAAALYARLAPAFTPRERDQLGI